MSVSNTDSWFEAQDIVQQRTFVRALAISFALHLGMALLFVIAPKPKPVYSPSVITVRMVSMPSAPSAAVSPTRSKAAPTKAPAPVPVPAQSKPAPVSKKVILPKRAAPVSKQAKPKPKPLAYDDALAALREELGEEIPAPVASTQPQEIAQTEVAENNAAASTGVKEDPVILAWKIATLRHIRQYLRVPQDFMNRSLSTELIVTLSSTGDVLGRPEITRSSTDPYWDDNVLRSLIRSSPLPPPPKPGDWPFRFTPEEGN